MKLLIEEEHSRSLREAVTGHMLVCSALALVEVPRALGSRPELGAWRTGWSALSASLRTIDLSRPLLLNAAVLPPPLLRSLDAIHLATAHSASGATAFVAYDRRLLDAARHSGLPVLSPGRGA